MQVPPLARGAAAWMCLHVHRRATLAVAWRNFPPCVLYNSTEKVAYRIGSSYAPAFPCQVKAPDAMHQGLRPGGRNMLFEQLTGASQSKKAGHRKKRRPLVEPHAARIVVSAPACRPPARRRAAGGPAGPGLLCSGNAAAGQQLGLDGGQQLRHLVHQKVATLQAGVRAQGREAKVCME